jgi:predicted transposase YdaD
MRIDKRIHFVEAQFQIDEQFIDRFFAEIFLSLKQNPTTKWQAVAM